ncbi:MAG: nucleotidyltransferase family protein [Methanosarcinaceae archaeon]
MKKDDVLAILRQFKKEYAQEYHLLRIGIFGSVARDEADEKSDVDIVFETDKPNLFRTSSMKVLLEDLLAQEIDIIRLRDNMNIKLKEEIQREVLYV